jgi:hypothetical protein
MTFRKRFPWNIQSNELILLAHSTQVWNTTSNLKHNLKCRSSLTTYLDLHTCVFLLDPQPCLFERIQIWRQISLVLIQTRSVRMYVFLHSDRPQNATAEQKNTIKASIPRCRQGKAGEKTNTASIPRKLCPQTLILSKIYRAAGWVVIILMYVYSKQDMRFENVIKIVRATSA